MNQAYFLLRFLAVIKYLKEELKLEFLVLKGPVYAATFPKHTQYSVITDLDIYPLGDKLEFARKLAESGRFYPEINPKQPNYLVIEEVQWIDLQTGLLMDVHSGVFTPYLGNAGVILDNDLGGYIHTLSLHGIDFTSLNKEFVALHLILHGEKHYWQYTKDRDHTQRYLHHIAGTTAQVELHKLLKVLKLTKLYSFSIDFIAKANGEKSYCRKHLERLQGQAYPKSMFQLWRWNNFWYHVRASGSLDMFFTRWISGLLPILPLAVSRFPDKSTFSIRVIHFLRICRLIKAYPQNQKWAEKLRKSAGN